MRASLVGIITGSMVIETIYGLPALGKLMARSTAITAGVKLLTILVGALTILFNAIVDVLRRYRPENRWLILES